MRGKVIAVRRPLLSALAGLAAVLLGTAPAWACGGLVAPNGTVNLLKTTTLAAYHDGVEHYVTSFEFAGGGGRFGSIVPLPGVPSAVERGGRWTLQRLVQEVQPPILFSAAARTSANAVDLESAVVILETRIEALDITILKGGGDAVGRWAEDNGFSLTPDAPEVLDFYAQRSPIFMAARFDAAEARERGQEVGDGTPIHLTIPTEDPWVPLRILGLGRQPSETIEADLFVLTDERPTMLPVPAPGGTNDGLVLERSEAASDLLLDDLRSDRGMDWIPDEMWLSYLTIEKDVAELTHDLAIDPTGTTVPSPVAAGLISAAGPSDPGVPQPGSGWGPWAWIAALVVGAGVLLGAEWVARRAG